VYPLCSLAIGSKNMEKNTQTYFEKQTKKIATKTSTQNYKEFIDTNIEKVPAQKIGILALVKRKKTINSLEI
jgi:hypothetical protein